jgi:hypothetical protein
VNREPFAKSAPEVSAATKLGISAGSVEPSASIITMMSPVAAANPQASALPLPRLVCVITRTSGRSWRAISGVPSVEWPSTTMTSCSPSGRAAKTCSRLRASLSAGMMTETRCVPACVSVCAATGAVTPAGLVIVMPSPSPAEVAMRFADWVHEGCSE